MIFAISPGRRCRLRAQVLLLLLLLLLVVGPSDAFQTVGRTRTSTRSTRFHSTAIQRQDTSTGTTSSHFCRYASPPTASSPSSVLRMSSSAAEEEAKKDDDKKMERKIMGRKKRVVWGYRIPLAIYSLVSAAMLIAPTMKIGLGMLAVAGNYAAGSISAAGFCYILIGAAQNNRLSSETYKRLNLNLSQYGAVYLAAALLVKCSAGPLTGGMKKLLSPVLLFASFVSFVNGIKGWSYGAKGWDKQSGESSFVGDFVDVFFRSWIRILGVVPKSMASLGYLAATLLAASLKLCKLVEIVQLLLPEIMATVATGGTPLSAASAGLITTRLIRFSKLSLLTAGCLTLKDAADRNRLTGTTFIQLNGLVSVTFGFMAAHLAKEAGTMTSLAGASAFFSFFSALMGVISFKLKRNKATS